MKLSDDPVALHLEALSRTTLGAAPPPPSLAFLRIVALRRHARRDARRLQRLLALSSAVPVAIFAIAWIVHPAKANLAILTSAIALIAFARATTAIAALVEAKGANGLSAS
jgi:hypothetical protein